MAESTTKGKSFSLPSADPPRSPLFTARLVGKLVHIHKFNFKALSSVLAFAWKLGDRVKFSPLQSGFLVCNFVCSKDLETVWKLGLWNF